MAPTLDRAWPSFQTWARASLSPDGTNFIVIIDYLKCRWTNSDVAKVIAHEIGHFLDGSENPARWARAFLAHAAAGSHATNPLEWTSRRFADEVMAGRDRPEMTWVAQANQPTPPQG